MAFLEPLHADMLSRAQRLTNSCTVCGDARPEC